MKKIICLSLILIMAISLVGCGKKNKGSENVDIADSVTLLNTVWASYDEAEKFPAGGGDFATEETTSMDGPAKVGIADAEVLDSMFGLPESGVAQIDDAASLSHMMNANTFTCGVFRVTDGTDMAEFTKNLRDHIQERQWMCGFPDKLCIMTVGNYVVSAFGKEEPMNTFRDKVQAAYAVATVAYEEVIE